jgi:4-amino-4-deoxy-L-arabinose transferase-like glycosyltransferase
MTRTVVLVLLIAAALRLVISGVIPVIDPTEGRYAQIAQEMAVSGDWVTPRVWNYGEQVPFLGKPPLFFWAAALSIKVFGANEFAVRLPSFLSAAALLILMFVVLSRYMSRRVAVSASVMTATSLLFFALSGGVALDMQLALFVTGALLAYLAFAIEPDLTIRKRWSLLVFLLLAGGFLTKGPVAIILFGMPVFLWTLWRKKWHLLRHHAWLTGILLFAVLVVPWFLLAEARNPGFLHYFFVNENLMRYLSPEYGDLYGTGHPYPRGSAIVMFFLGALPWSMVAAWLAVRMRWSGMREILNDDVRSFLLLGFVANVAFWCFARQLLPTYMAPMIPMLTVWIAVSTRESEGALRGRHRIAFVTLAVWFVLLIGAIPALSRDSTREILEEAARVARELNIPVDVTFADRTPQSALFYAPETVHDHPKEDVKSTVQRILDTGERRLLIIRDGDLKLVPTKLLDHLLLVGQSKGRLLYVTRIQ